MIANGPGWHRILLRTAGIGGATLAAQLPGVLVLERLLTWGDMAALCAEIAFNGGVLGLFLALALERCGRRGSDPRELRTVLRSVAATYVVALACSYAAVTFVSVRIGLVDSIDALRLHQAWVDMLVATLALAYVLQRDVSIEAESRYHQHELQRRLARDRAEATLARATHLRLDARTLLRALDEAMAIYGDDPRRADGQLERLTSYLRVVMKASQSSVATLRDEVAIGAALLPLARGDLALACDIPARFDALTIPPGALPALLRAWADALPPQPSDDSSFAARVDGSDTGATLEIAGPCPVPDAAVAACREAFAAGSRRAGDAVVRLDAKHLRLCLEATRHA